MKINVIRPLYNRQQMKIPDERNPGVSYLPTDYYSFRISLRRLWLKPKVGLLRILMNPVGQRPHIIKKIPDCIEMDVSENAIGECGVPHEEQDSYACKMATQAIRAKFTHYWWEPSIEILEVKSLYKAVLIDRWPDEIYLYDTYTGKKILADSPLFPGENGLFGPKGKPSGE